MEQELYPELPILVVDDEKHFLTSIESLLLTNGINNVECCQNSRKVMPLLEKNEFSLILLDIKMPGLRGDKLFHLIDAKYPHIPVIILTGHNEMRFTFQKMEFEYLDFILKPVDAAKLIEKIQQTINYSFDFPEIVTKSKRMLGIFNKVRILAKASVDILITGEPGVGKELVARAIHRLSLKKGKIVTMNISGKDDRLFLKKLFGHKKSANKDSIHDREGKIEEAKEGTLFIDEIGDLSDDFQVKLLNLIEKRTYYPVGAGNTPISTTARIVLASKYNLKAIMAEGKFREDLYYKLFDHHIHVPPLRDRKEDIPCLVEYFIKRESKKFGKNIPKIFDETLQVLSDYNYQGNIRELKNIINRVVSIYHYLPELPPELFKNEILLSKKKNRKINWKKLINPLAEVLKRLLGI